jgi:hypothetical protein
LASIDIGNRQSTKRRQHVVPQCVFLTLRQLASCAAMYMSATWANVMAAACGLAASAFALAFSGLAFCQRVQTLALPFV